MSLENKISITIKYIQFEKKNYKEPKFNDNFGDGIDTIQATYKSNSDIEQDKRYYGIVDVTFPITIKYNNTEHIFHLPQTIEDYKQFNYLDKSIDCELYKIPLNNELTIFLIPLDDWFIIEHEYVDINHPLCFGYSYIHIN